ncbi:MAG TPA: Holliday junction resolvase RuvX [Gammaproteobacteria bacterium]|nr:Holliday junction resolvase RuvX [Gammaproteobacteria bacterium]
MPDRPAKGHGTLLGFDYGDRRIGVAVAHPAAGSGRPLTTLTQRSGDAVLRAVAELIDEWRPQMLVVGLPLSLDGTPHALTAAARRFANRLHGRFGLPVRLVDERLSSVEARDRLRRAREAGRRRRVRRDEVDALAALLILETFMEQPDEAHG